MKIMGSFVYCFSWLIYEHCKKNTLNLYHVYSCCEIYYLVLITSRGAIETRLLNTAIDHEFGVLMEAGLVKLLTCF